MTFKPSLVKYRRALSCFIPEPKKILAFLLVVLLVVVVIVYRPVWQLLASKLSLGPQFISNLSKKPAESLVSTNNRTNILLLGMGGAGHEAGNLTDSMIIISYQHQTNKVKLISLPRDFWVDSMKAKINTAYYYGEKREPNKGGLVLSKAAAEEISGLPIHYSVALDFSGFKKAIDLVGGVDVDVERAFDDYKYPIPGKENVYPEADRYEHLRFDAGMQHMDGERALKFVRSRHAEGDEGTDFARSARQDKVILAFKDRMLSVSTLFDPNKISSLASLYGEYIHTDIKDTDYSSFVRLAMEIKKDLISSVLLTTGDEKTKVLGILEVGDKSLYQGQYVLVPRDNNKEALKQYIQNELEK